MASTQGHIELAREAALLHDRDAALALLDDMRKGDEQVAMPTSVEAPCPPVHGDRGSVEHVQVRLELALNVWLHSANSA
jgi:hypothetical protein